MAADVYEAIRYHLPSVPACCGSPCGGGVGLGVRLLPNRMWWGVLASWWAFLLWGECIARGNGLITRNFLCTTHRRTFLTRPVYHITTQSSNPFPLPVYPLFLFSYCI